MRIMINVEVRMRVRVRVRVRVRGRGRLGGRHLLHGEMPPAQAGPPGSTRPRADHGRRPKVRVRVRIRVLP